MKIRRKLYETTVLFNMVRITYVWNIFKKEKNCYNTFMGRNFCTCFVFNSCLHLYIFYPINKQNHPFQGDFLFEKIPGGRVKRGVIGAE